MSQPGTIRTWGARKERFLSHRLLARLLPFRVPFKTGRLLPYCSLSKQKSGQNGDAFECTLRPYQRGNRLLAVNESLVQPIARPPLLPIRRHHLPIELTLRRRHCLFEGTAEEKHLSAIAK